MMENLRPKGYDEAKLREFWRRTVNVTEYKVTAGNPSGYLTVKALLREQEPDGHGHWATVKTIIRDDAEIGELIVRLEARINAILAARFPIPPVPAATDGESDAREKGGG
jgi:hypothetical protein